MQSGSRASYGGRDLLAVCHSSSRTLCLLHLSFSAAMLAPRATSAAATHSAGTWKRKAGHETPVRASVCWKCVDEEPGDLGAAGRVTRWDWRAFDKDTDVELPRAKKKTWRVADGWFCKGVAAEVGEGALGRPPVGQEDACLG